MPDIRAGIIGCGNMGQVHMRQLKGLGVHIRALADPRTDVIEPLKDEVGAEYLADDGRELIDDKEIDAIVVATHHDLHTPFAVAAAQAGKHVFIEKPLALTIEECEEIQAQVNKAGVKAMCGFQARFSPFCAKLREEIGVPLVLVAALVDPMWGPAHWANDPKEGGGNILSQGCHMFDMMCYFAQSIPEIIHAEGGNLQHPTLPIADSIVATMKFKNGVIAAAINGDFGLNAALGKATYHLYGGQKTGALLKYYNEPELHFWGRGAKDRTLTCLDLLPDELKDQSVSDRRSQARLWVHGYPQQIEAFVHWLVNDERHPDTCGVPEAAMATRMAARCIESTKKQARVTL